MKKLLTLIVVFHALVFYLTSCSIYTYEVIDKNKPVKGEYKKFATPSEAIKDLSTENTLNMPMSEDEKLLSLAIIKQKANDVNAADSLFSIVYGLSKDLNNISFAKYFLESNLLLNGNYKEYLNIFKIKGESDSVAIKRLGYPEYSNYPFSIKFNNEIDTIPIQYNFGQVYVPVYLNDNTIPRFFKLSLSNAFSYEYENAYNVSSDIIYEFPLDKLVNINDETFPDKLGVYKSIRIGKNTVSNLRMRVYKTIRDPKAERNPILGFDFFKNFDVQIDVKNKILILKKPQKKYVAEQNLFFYYSPIIIYKTSSDLFATAKIFFPDNRSCHYLFIDQEPENQFYSPAYSSFFKTKHFESYDKYIFNIGNVLLESNGADILRLRKNYFCKIDFIISNQILKTGVLNYDFLNGFFEIKPY